MPATSKTQNQSPCAMPTSAWASSIALMSALALPITAGCKQPTGPTAAEQAASQARAVEITEKMLKVYREAKTYADHATYVEESVLRGEGVAHEFPYYEMTIALKRPNFLRISFAEAVADFAGKRNGFEIACDGETLRAAVASIPDQMIENPSPAEFTFDNVLVDPVIRGVIFNRPLGEVLPQLAMLINQSDNDEDAVFPNDSNPRMLPDERIGNALCYRVATSHPEGTRVLWIDRNTYALRRMELPTDGDRQRTDPDGHYLRYSIRIDFEDPIFDAQIDEKTFNLEPKAGARRVRRFVEPEAAAPDEADKPAEETAGGKDGGTAKDAKSAKEDVPPTDLTPPTTDDPAK